LSASSKEPDLAGFISSTLETDGICVLEKWVDGVDLSQCQEEVISLLDGPAGDLLDIGYENGTGRMARSPAIEPLVPSVLSAMSTAVLQSVASTFFDRLSQPFMFNYDVIATRDLPGTTHYAQAPHFDRRPHLKFFLYLTDVELSQGPISCLVASHKSNRAVQDRAIRDQTLASTEATRAVNSGGAEPVLGGLLRRGIGWRVCV